MNTSSDDLLKERIKHKDATDSRELILQLINNEPIVKDIYENFVFTDMDAKRELIWTLMLFSGYLTIVRYELRIPNYEIKFVFQSIILDWFEVEVKIIKKLLEDTANDLVTNQLEKFAEGFKKIIGDTFSYYDTENEPEKVYHSYVLGLLAILSDDYIIRSNRESGEGTTFFIQITFFTLSFLLSQRKTCYPCNFLFEAHLAYYEYVLYNFILDFKYIRKKNTGFE
ncbi:MAG: hypothetical protein KDK90_02215 [Leptospiraceae bacterium]|nr:hypothetical protein [Leptospiraceae bacterium]